VIFNGMSNLDPMVDVCLHELPLGQCGFCKPPPPGINLIVYVTKGGLAFHNSHQCRTLLEGQVEANSKGLMVHPINPVGWSVALAGRRPCRNCCPEYRHPK